MNAWARIGEVARREIVVRGRSRAYLLTTALLALAVSILAALPSLLDGDDDQQVSGPTLTVAVVGDGDADVDAALGFVEALTGRPVERTVIDAGAAARTAVEEEEVRLAVDTTGSEPVVIGRAPAFFGESDGLANFVADVISRTRALRAEGLDDDAIGRALLTEPVEVLVAAADDGTEGARRGGVAYGGLMFMYTTLVLYGTWAVNGVIEEKSSRVVEVLLATVKPRELMAGKVLGLGSLGIAQVLAVIAPAIVVSSVIGDGLVPSGAVPAVVGIAGWWVLGFLLFASLMAAMGSLVQRQEDTQSAIIPVMVPVLAGFFLAITALEDPSGPLAIVGTWVPFTAPMVMVVRTTVGAAAWWEVVGSIAVVGLAGVGATLLAGRIYAGAILRTRGRVKLREAWRGAN